MRKAAGLDAPLGATNPEVSGLFKPRRPDRLLARELELLKIEAHGSLACSLRPPWPLGPSVTNRGPRRHPWLVEATRRSGR